MRLRLLLLCFIAWTAQTETVADPYAALGVNRGSTSREIKQAYRRLAQKFHPDKNPARSAQRRFLEIQESYEILSDPAKKQEYEDLRRFGQATHSDGASNRGRRRHADYQFHQHFDFGGPRFNFFTRLESSTADVSSDAFFRRVLPDARPWLLEIFEDSSGACQRAAAQWEAAHQALAPEGVQLGRVRFSRDPSLASLLVRAVSPFRSAVSFEDLPVIVGVPPDCSEASCAVMFHGMLTSGRLQMFVADKLLRYPKVPTIEVSKVAAWVDGAPLHKVAIVAVSDAGPHASFKLRKAAHRHPSIAAARVMMTQLSAPALRQLGVTRSPAVLVYKSPLRPPTVLQAGWGFKLDIEATFSEHERPEVVPLHAGTAQSLGCHYAAGALQPPEKKAATLPELWVIALAQSRAQQVQALQALVSLGSALQADRVSRVGAALARAAKGGKVRLTWADAAAQRPFCAFHVRAAGWAAASPCDSPWLQRARLLVPGAGPTADHPFVLVIAYTADKHRQPHSYRVGLYRNVSADRPGDLAAEPLHNAASSPLVTWLKAVWNDPASMLDEVVYAGGLPPGLRPPLEPVLLRERLSTLSSLGWEAAVGCVAAVVAMTPEHMRPMLPLGAIAAALLAVQCVIAAAFRTPPPRPRSRAAAAAARSAARAAAARAAAHHAALLALARLPPDAPGAARALRVLVAERLDAMVRAGDAQLLGARLGASAAPRVVVVLVIDLVALVTGPWPPPPSDQLSRDARASQDAVALTEGSQSHPVHGNELDNSCSDDSADTSALPTDMQAPHGCAAAEDVSGDEDDAAPSSDAAGVDGAPPAVRKRRAPSRREANQSSGAVHSRDRLQDAGVSGNGNDSPRGSDASTSSVLVQRAREVSSSSVASPMRSYSFPSAGHLITEACEAVSSAAVKFQAQRDRGLVTFTAGTLDTLAPAKREAWRDFLDRQERGGPCALLVHQPTKSLVCFVPSKGGVCSLRDELEGAVEKAFSGSGRWQLVTGDLPLRF